jgi:hypothetical protein
VIRRILISAIGIVIVLAVIAALVSATGDSDSEDSAAAGEDTTTSTTAAEPLTTADASGTSTAPAETVTTTTRPTTTTTRATTTTTQATTTTTIAIPAGNRAPEVTITSPGNLASFIAAYNAGTGTFGSTVTLTATATDADGDPVTIEWYSSDQGYLGSGASISAFLNTINSDASQPIITARAIDQWGASSDSSVQVIVWIPSPT